MIAEEIFFILDKIGIVAFGNAGGIIRDLTLARVPYAISNIDYLLYALLASLAALLFYQNKI